MGHYRKKQYKKKSLDTFSNIDVFRDYLNELKSNEYKDLFEDPYAFDYKDNTYSDNSLIDEHSPKLIVDEPEIVTQLKKEEQNGTLPVWLLSKNEEIRNNLSDHLPVFEEILFRTENVDLEISYEKSFEIAKKIFQGTQVKHVESILFTEEVK
jgi:hypothetical protein